MKTFSITDVGMVRQVNQDYVYMTDNPLGPLPNLFVVADGMGGHQGVCHLQPQYDCRYVQLGSYLTDHEYPQIDL